VTEDGRLPVLGVVAAGNFAQLGARLLLGAVVPLVILRFEVGKSTVGLALTGMWAVYAFLQFPSGVLADRYGERRLLLVGLTGTIVGTVLVAAAPTFALYGGAVLVLGAGAGLFFSPASSLLSRLFEERGGALGALTAGGAVAGLVYPALGGAIGVTHGWRVAVGLAAAVTLPALAATVWVVPTVAPANPDRSLRAALDGTRLWGLLTRPGVAYTTVLAVAFGFTFQALSSFFPTFLVEHRGFDTGTAGVVFGVVFGLSSVAQPIAGWVSDRLLRDVALGGSATLAATGIAVLLVVPGVTGTALGTVVLGAGVSWPGAIQARYMDQFTDAERGYGFGLVRSVYMLLAASGSAAVGGLAEVGGWTFGYGAVVVLLVVALLALATNRLLGLGL
jgi:predicted MFS family arabinose efflux permease